MIRWVSCPSLFSVHLCSPPHSVHHQLEAHLYLIRWDLPVSSSRVVCRISYPPPQGSSVMDTTTGSSLPNRYKALCNPGFWCVFCFPYSSFKFLTSHIVVCLFSLISQYLQSSSVLIRWGHVFLSVLDTTRSRLRPLLSFSEAPTTNLTLVACIWCSNDLLSLVFDTSNLNIACICLIQQFLYRLTVACIW